MLFRSDNCGQIVDMFEEEFPNIVVTRVEVFKYLQQSEGKKYGIY